MAPVADCAAAGYVRTFVGLGSNLGDRQAQIDGAIEWLAAHPEIRLISHTEVMETEPWGLTDQPGFLNAVAEVETRLAPTELLALLKDREKEQGRIPRAVRWGPREIDLDILLYGDLVLETPDLSIPHPGIESRSFVARQLVELDPELVHPALGRPVKTLQAL